MRKAKDERIKITTHNFRISIEEEDEDAEPKNDEEQQTTELPAEVPAAPTARRTSISIESEPGTSLVADLDDLNPPVAVEQSIVDQPAHSPSKILEIEPVLEGPGGSSLSREDEERRVERPEVFQALTGLDEALTAKRVSITIETEPQTSLVAAPGELDQPVIAEPLVRDREQAQSPLKILEIETLLGDGGPGRSIVPERDEKSRIAGAEDFEGFTGLHSGFMGLEGPRELEDPEIRRLEGPREPEDLGLSTTSRVFEAARTCELKGSRRLEDPETGEYARIRGLEGPSGVDDPRIREFERFNESEGRAEAEKPPFDAEGCLADLAVPDADRASNLVGDLAASMTIADRNLAGFHAGNDLSRKSSLDATLYRNSQKSHGPRTASDHPAGLSNYAAMRGEAPESREGRTAIKVESLSGSEQVAGSEEYVGRAPIKDEAKLKFWIESGEQKGADPWELRFPRARTFEAASIEDRKSLIKRRAGFKSSNQPETRVPKVKYSTERSSESSDSEDYQASKKGGGKLSVIDQLMSKSWSPTEKKDSRKSTASTRASKRKSSRSSDSENGYQASKKDGGRLSVIDQLMSKSWNPTERKDSRRSTATIVKRKSSWTSGSSDSSDDDYYQARKKGARRLSVIDKLILKSWNPMERRDSQRSSASAKSSKDFPESPRFSERPDTARSISLEGQPRSKFWNPLKRRESQKSVSSPGSSKAKVPDSPGFSERLNTARSVSPEDQPRWKSWNPELKDSRRTTASAAKIKRKSTWTSGSSDSSDDDYYQARKQGARRLSVIDKLILKSWNPMERKDSQRSSASAKSSKDSPRSPGFSERLDTSRSIWNPLKRRESQKSVSSSGSFKGKVPDSPGFSEHLNTARSVSPEGQPRSKSWNPFRRRESQKSVSSSGSSKGKLPDSPGPSSEEVARIVPCTLTNVNEVEKRVYKPRSSASSTSSGHVSPAVAITAQLGAGPLFIQRSLQAESSLDDSTLTKQAPEGANTVQVDDELLSKRRLTMPMVLSDEKSAANLLIKSETAARSSLDGGSSSKKWDSSDTEEDVEDDRLLLKRRLTMPMVLFDEKRATSRVDPLLFRKYLKAKAAVRSSLEDFALKRQDSGDAKTVEADDQVLLQSKLAMPIVGFDGGNAAGQAESLPIGLEAEGRSSADDCSLKREDSGAKGAANEALSQRRLTVPTVEFAANSVRASPLLLRRSLKAAGQTGLHVSGLQDSVDGKEESNQVLTMRRLTMPMVGFNQDSAKSPTHDPLSGTSVNPIRRSSIANAAICSSLVPSLVGVWPGIPDYLLPSGEDGSAGSVPNTSDSFGKSPSSGLKLKFPFLRLHIPEQQQSSTWQDPEDPGQHPHHHHHHHHHVFSHFHVPTITFTAQTDGESGRKFNFGIRRHSQTTLHRTDSMVSLCYRSLASYITDDNLAGLQNFLENKRVQVDDRDENGSTALILAASKGKIHFVRELVNHGADVNAEDGDNWTALLCAAKEGHADVCLELLEHGADLEHRDMGGWTALMWATYKGRSPTVTMLLARGADVNAHGNFHISSLLWAAGRGYPDIVKDLIAHGAKVNVGDKYGTTALVWGSRKGNVEIVDTLLKGGANVDTAGMYSWTALLVATLGNHVDVVLLLLEHKPNVNALDKDGCTALAIACREGHHEIANALLNSGAYVNIQDRAGDTNLIHAVKGGHRGVVESLLKKYADVDIAGKDKKTATYIAVEKGNIPILKLLLNANPDLEIATKDGDTPLLRAVRSRNAEIVQLLLDKKAKVSATDKKGDTVLHIAMRARSKAIVEILLRNPKNSQLLYRPNRQGETPYNIDINHPKTILGQIFGARRLNTNEDNENMLGYDLYSSALADILSEPSLSTPITVGLYAKWGSGKSFLLNKLKEEMKNFARQWIDPVFQFSFLLFVVVTHASLLVGITIGLALQSWITGLACGISLIVITYAFLILIWYANKRYDWYWPYNFTVALTTKLNSLKLLLQVIFCHPPGGQVHDGVTAQPIKFYFTDQTRVGTTAAGENAVVQMVGSLYDSIENDFGSLSTRLYRAFRPKPDKSTTTWKWRHLCCLPYIVIFEFCFCSLLVGISVLTVYLIDLSTDEETIEKVTAHIIMITVALILGVSIIANLYTWNRTLQALVFSQRRHLQRSISKLETLKSEGFIQTLRSEVSLMTEMVKCLDSFMAQQSRLVIIVDGLDSCEQDKVLLVLDAIQALFSDNGYPFVVILAIDPHIIAKAVEVNSRRLFTESNIGGHDYLRNMVHLPFYLQNSGLRKVKIAQQTAQHGRKTTWTEAEESVTYTATSTMHHSMSNRRLSTESGIMNSNEKLKPQSRKGSRKLRLSESIASSIGSNLNRLGGAQDLNKMLLTDDYFSDVNPRSMRRLMNVVYVTGRLLKAFQIDFNWYHLASWINITEQWPFRTSWLILHYDMYEDNLDDTMSLKSLYDKIRPQIPVLKEVQPLLEMDRDERKLDIFLTFHRSSLLVSDMKIFLPFTINLDPYIKKKIKEEQQSIEEDAGLGPYKQYSPWTMHGGGQESWNASRTGTTNRAMKLARTPSLQGPGQVPSTPAAWCMQPSYDWQPPPPWVQMPPMEPAIKPLSAITTLPSEILEIRLSSLTVSGICDLIDRIESLNPNQAPQYKNVIKENNINGRVLLHCDLQELKKVLKMAFGDWELFRMVVVSLREVELSSFSTHEEGPRSVRFTVGLEQIQRKDHNLQNTSIRVPTIVEKEKGTTRTDGPSRRDQTKQSIMEKQVTLEEQMICGALQTLNEEACEDVLDVPSPAVVPSDSLPGSTSAASQDTDYVILQSNPLLHWVPVNDEPETSDDSSLESTVQLQRTNSQRSIASQHSTRSTCSFGRRKDAGNGTSSRPSSLFVSPPPSPRPAFRSKSTDENYVANNIPLKPTISTPIKKLRSTSTLNEEIVLPVPVLNSSLEKLSKLKDRLMGTLPASPGPGESEDESTPLVSEMSTPTHSQSDSVFKHDYSEENSSSVSSNKSLPRDGERNIDVDYSDTVSLMVRESMHVRFVSRQDAEEWDNPETPV